MPLNYDICAGGKLPFAIPSLFSFNLNTFLLFGYNVNNHGREYVCHSPLFSTSASTENITTQSQLNRSVSSIMANGFSPFNEIYAGNAHTGHTDSRGDMLLVWEQLLSDELNIIASTGCNISTGTMGIAPTPYINGNRFYMCEYDRRVQFWDNDPSAIFDLFNYNWTVTGPESFPPGVGERYTISYPTPGYYTLSLTRSYRSPINGTTSAAYSRVIRSYPYWDPFYGCDETGPIRSSNLTESPIQEVGLKVFPNPNQGNILNVEFVIDQDQDVEISLQAIDGKLSNRKILIKGKRPKGSYSDKFDISDSSNGIYIIILKTSNERNSQKLIIQK